ncbi:MAG TPA: alpha/beta fold hydrolase [Bradyrhizobium sp.]|nr:alpha/beta fold hydrolase [Bradyrhizobium sp.]
MMSRYSTCGRVPFRWIFPLCAIMTFALLSVLPIGAAAQGVGNPPVLAPGLHERTLVRVGEPGVSYAISIPPSYSPSTPVPLILALHYGIGNRDSTGVGADLVKGLIGPALVGLGAIIVAPDSVRGNWSTSENEKAVNALLDMVMAHYAIDRKRVAVTGYSMGGTGSWYLAEKFPERFSAAIPIASRPPASAAGWRLPVLAIHSRDDQVVPFDPAAARIAEIQKAGVNARLIALTGIAHYEAGRFREPLRQAIPWLQEVWK